jgi:hypothetical protein
MACSDRSPIETFDRDDCFGYSTAPFRLSLIWRELKELSNRTAGASGQLDVDVAIFGPATAGCGPPITYAGRSRIW